MVLRRYLLNENEAELREIEKDLAEYLDVPFVRCSYDCINSHKYQDEEEISYRRTQIEIADDTTMLDYIINYEIYSTEEDYEDNCGGDDGEVYELHYLEGNGKYIVIVGV